MWIKQVLKCQLSLMMQVMKVKKLNTNPEQTETEDNLVFYDKIKIVEGPHNPCYIYQ